MNIIRYPTDRAVAEAISAKDPLLVLISFDGSTVIMSHIDEAVEHCKDALIKSASRFAGKK